MQKTPWQYVLYIYIYIASCISKYQISDQLFARIESCAGLMDGLQPNLRCGHLTEFANSLVLPCLARPANAPQPEAKSLTQMKAKKISKQGNSQRMSKDDKGGWGGSEIIGHGSGVIYQHVGC